MMDIPPTPAATLTMAREIGLRAGLRYVYTGNVHDRTGGTTYCAGCGKPVIVRDWYEILRYELTDDGRCPHCDASVPGRFGVFDRAWGRRRRPVRVAVRGETARARR
jgi:pyruvate formate lyase activating enzyme